MKVEQISIDLDRILRVAERREKKVVEAFHATHEANRDALERLGEILAARFADAATPFPELLSEHPEEVGLHAILDARRVLLVTISRAS